MDHRFFSNPFGPAPLRGSKRPHPHAARMHLQSRVKLDLPPSIQRVTLDGDETHLFHFEKYVLSFIPTPGQRRKIVEHEGFIRIAESQIVRRA